MGIVNGTTNYILTKMTEDGASYGDALAEAQRLGFAERDPTADVEGFDAGAKAAIIATIAFGARVVAGDVYHEGISRVTVRRHRQRPPPRLRGQVAGHLRAGSRRRCRRRPGPPGDGAGAPPTGQRSRELQRRVRRGRRRRLAHVLRPRRRRHADGQCRPRRSHRRRRQPAEGHARLAGNASAECRSGPSTRPPPSTTSCSTWSTGPACCMRSRASSPATRSASVPPSRRVWAMTPGWCSSPTRPRRPRFRPRSSELRDLDVVKRVGGFLRVIGA